MSQVPLFVQEARMPEELGKVNYEAYGDSVNWTTFSGTPMPSWEEQNDKLRQAWNAGAEAVARRVRDE